MRKFHLSIFLILMMNLVLSCNFTRESKMTASQLQSSSLPDPITDNSQKPTPTTPSALIANVSFRNFMQINESMSIVTGINPNSTTGAQSPATIFQNSRSNFSSQGSTESMTPSNLLATSALAGAYCKRLVEVERPLNSDQRRFFGAVDFALNQAALSATVKTTVITRYAEYFWRRSPTAQEIAILSSAMDETVSGEASSTVALNNALQVSCTAALSSLEFLKS